MAHEIEQRTDYHYASEDGLPWHGLGVQRRKRMTLADVVEALPRMAETPVLRPALYRDRDGDLRVCDSKCAIVYPSDDKYIGMATTGYQPKAFADAFDKVFGWVDSLGAWVSGAALLRGGSRAFIVARIPGLDFEVGGDEHHMWLSVFAGSDGCTGIYPMGTLVRTVCANTALAGIQEAKAAGRGFSVAHHGDVDAKLAEASTALSQLSQVRDAYGRACATLIAKALSDAAAKDVLGTLVEGDSSRAENTRDSIIRLARYGKGNARFRGTAYALWQGVTDHVDHQAVKTSAGDVNERRFLYAAEGAGAALKARALDMLLAA